MFVSIVLATLLLVAPGMAQTDAQDDATGDGTFAMEPAAAEVLLAPGQTIDETIVLTTSGYGQNLTFVVEVEAPPLLDWDVTVTPKAGRLGGDDSRALSLTLVAGDDPRPRTFDLTYRVTLLDPEGDEVTTEAHPMHVRLSGATTVLGLWDNPLPPPLDGAFGTFLLNAAAWLLIAVLVAFLIDPFLRLVTSRTRTEADDHIIRILRFPVFLALFAFGLKQSLEAFELPAWAFRVLDRVYLVLLVIAIVYASYRVWQEIVLSVGRRMASRTESQLDDRLLPVFEKTGGIIIVVVGLFYVLDALGVNMTVFAAGGAITGLVIAFAAQDTLSNFFSGIFLMIDQPFREGDDIILDTGEVVQVAHIGLRTTELYHRANHETIIIPNNLLATNRTINLLKPDDKYKIRIDVGVAYGSDIQLVKRLLLDIVREHPLTLKEGEHEPFVRFQAFGASSLDFSVHGWVGNVYERWLVASDVREMIDVRFAEHHIEIPFPQRVVWQGAEEKAKLDQARDAGPPAAPTTHATTAASPTTGSRTGSEAAAMGAASASGTAPTPDDKADDAQRQVGSTSETGGEAAGGAGGDGGAGGGEDV